MKIRFTHDFRGKLTDERFYPEGTEIEVDADTGAQLVALFHAVDVTPAPPAPVVEDRGVPKEHKPTRRASKPKADSEPEAVKADDDGEPT